MNSVWHWLTEPQHIPVLTAIVAFLAALVGGVLTQLVAGIFKNWGDTRQINAADRIAAAAEKRWQYEQEQVRKQYLLEARRDAYIRLLVGLEEHSMVLFEYVNLERQSSYEVYTSAKKLRALSSEAGLYSLKVGEITDTLGGVEPRLETLTKDNLDEKMKPWSLRRKEVSNAIRRDLGLEDQVDTAHT